MIETKNENELKQTSSNEFSSKLNRLKPNMNWNPNYKPKDPQFKTIWKRIENQKLFETLNRRNPQIDKKQKTNNKEANLSLNLPQKKAIYLWRSRKKTIDDGDKSPFRLELCFFFFAFGRERIFFHNTEHNSSPSQPSNATCTRTWSF